MALQKSLKNKKILNGQAIQTFAKSRSYKKKRPTVVASLMLIQVIACLVAESMQLTWIFYLCRPTVTLYQGLSPQNEHEYICHPQLYRHAKFECNRLNIVRYITS